MLRTRVYVAGPITLGDVEANVRHAIRIGMLLLDKGYAPFIPHLSHFAEPAATWDKNRDRYERWLELDKSYISTCHALLRLPGESKGADQETEWAKACGLKVYDTLEELLLTLPARSPW